ncbi:MAG: hypothetical protein R3A11_00125 [Bdellovibrionota bacterium]
MMYENKKKHNIGRAVTLTSLIKGILIASMMACNSGLVGFNAPDLATVEFTVPTQSFQLSSGELLVRMVAKVNVDIGVESDVEGSSIVNGTANKVFILIDCFGCNLYTKRSGESEAVPVYSRIQLEQDGVIEAQTNAQGLYDFVAGFSAPAPDDNYTTTIRADIGVSTGQATVSVSNPVD